jgi:3-deoxy-D-arabino-heptulosonate 7-phosphate (DAHP) synthase class II
MGYKKSSEMLQKLGVDLTYIDSELLESLDKETEKIETGRRNFVSKFGKKRLLKNLAKLIDEIGKVEEK